MSAHDEAAVSTATDPPAPAGRRPRCSAASDAWSAAGVPSRIQTLIRMTDEDRRYLTTLYDDRVPAARRGDRDAAAATTRGSRAAAALRGARARPVRDRSRWNARAVETFLDLRYFRGETLITWHYRELPRITALKYFVFARYVARATRSGCSNACEEDGAFGCWTFEYPGYGRFSRDLLESVNEIAFLERELGLSEHRELRGPRHRRGLRAARPTGCCTALPERHRLLLRRRDPRVDVPQRVLPRVTAA